MELLDLVREYGDLYYLIVFVWTFLEGETFVIFSGAAAREGVLSLPTLITCAWIGSFCGDQVYFLIGRRYGTRILKRLPRWKAGVDKALALLARYNTGFILTFRFVYGVRNVSSFAMGMSPIGWGRFACLNFVAAGLWSVAFTGAGYFAGAAFQHVLGDLATGLGVVMLGLFLIAIWVLVRVGRRRPAPAASGD